MRVFVTGATGFIGTHVVPELIAGGHKVLGMARTDDAARSLAAMGAEAHHGTLEDTESLKRGAAAAEAVIHLAFNHDFSKFKQNSELDQRAIEALGSVLAGSDRPLIVTAGAAGIGAPGELATEEMDVPADFPLPRVSEQTALSLIRQGVRASVMRLPQVHDTVRQGLISYVIALARQQGVSAYVGAGTNRWAAAHVADVARLYRIALERNEAGVKYHAVDEQGVALRDIAEVVGRGLKVPVKSITTENAPAHFGFLAAFIGQDLIASSALTRKRTGWNPTGPKLIEDLEKMDYSNAS